MATCSISGILIPDRHLLLGPYLKAGCVLQRYCDTASVEGRLSSSDCSKHVLGHYLNHQKAALLT